MELKLEISDVEFGYLRGGLLQINTPLARKLYTKLNEAREIAQKKEYLNVETLATLRALYDSLPQCMNCGHDTGDRGTNSHYEHCRFYSECTSNPCICTNGIGCANVPWDKW